MICPYCNTDAGNAVICPSCGKQLTDIPDPENQQTLSPEQAGNRTDDDRYSLDRNFRSSLPEPEPPEENKGNIP